MKIVINGKEVKGKKFVFDGCHKIYVLEDELDEQGIYEKGYEENDIFNIEDIENIYQSSCPLRFISNWKLTVHYVAQFEDAVFEIDGVKTIHRNTEEMYS